MVNHKSALDFAWPAMIEMDRATKTKVDAMWAKLGL
jgi:3-polyprenyl-4-hydroxybenzoate decarboxylase